MPRRRAAKLLLACLLQAPLSGCTLRYSQTLAGEVVRIQGTPMQNSDSGVAVGIGFPGGTATIAFSEPMHAGELLNVPCEVALAAVDYRAMYFGYYLAVDFPAVEVVSYCIPSP
jgi:hypothetical protein